MDNSNDITPNSFSSSDSYDLQTEPEKLIEDVGKDPISRWGGGDDNEAIEKPTVLEPDHPLLVKFQQTLRAHLLQQTARIREEVMELEAAIKDQEKARELLGIAVYDRQQDVCRQTKKLDECQKELSDLLVERERQEKELVDTKKKFNSEYENFKNEDHKERSLRTELEGLALLDKQLSKWKSDMESELNINQRISDKTLQEKRLLADEKKQLDMLIYKLMTEVWKSEAELTEMDMQLRVMEKRREELGFAVQDGHANLEAINSQKTGLVRAWNNVILSIQRRDQKYTEAQNIVSKINMDIKTINCEIEGYNQSIEKEMNEHLRLTGLKSRVENDIANIAQQRKLEDTKLSNLELELGKTQAAMAATNRDLISVNAINLSRETELGVIIKEVDRQATVKVEIEDKIMNALDNCVTNDKAAKYLNKMLRQLKEKTRTLEIQMTNAENTDAKLLVEIEHQRGINAANAEYLENLQKMYKDKDAAVNKLNMEQQQLVNAATKKQRVLDGLQKKLADLMAKAGKLGHLQGRQLSPQQIKINELERNIGETETNIASLEVLWMTQQTHIVTLSQQRNEQLQEINKLRKQIMILTQKNLSLEDEMEKHNQRESQMYRNVEKLTKRLESLDISITNHKHKNNKVDNDTMMIHSKYMTQLQDAERECSQLETDIADLDQEKESLTQQLVEVNRETLTWERQAIMATEARKNIEKEKTSTGDIGAMRNEIHRMHVRYGQLRRAQERLIVDLEFCVSRRDAIINGSFAKEKSSQNGLSQTRMHFERKCVDMRAKIKQVLKDTDDFKMKCKKLDEEQQELEEQLGEEEQKIQDAIDTVDATKEQCFIRELKKARDLDKLIKRQHKAKRYDELLRGNFRARSKNIIDIEKIKQAEMTDNLTKILQALTNDFPQRELELQKILSCLHTES